MIDKIIYFRFDPEAGAPRRLGGVVTVDVDTGLQPETGNKQLVDNQVKALSSRMWTEKSSESRRSCFYPIPSRRNRLTLDRPLLPLTFYYLRLDRDMYDV